MNETQWTNAENGASPGEGIPCVVWDGILPQLAVWRRDMGTHGGFASIKCTSRGYKFTYIEGVRAFIIVPDMPKRAAARDGES